MNGASYVGRIGGLAVALGVGAAVFTSPATAWAVPDSSNPSASSDGTSSTSSTPDSESPTTSTDSSSSEQTPTDAETSANETSQTPPEDDEDPTETAETDATETDATETDTTESAGTDATETDATEATDTETDATETESTQDPTETDRRDTSPSRSTDAPPSSPAPALTETTTDTGTTNDIDLETASPSTPAPTPTAEVPPTASALSSVSTAQSSPVATMVAAEPATSTAATPTPSFSTTLATVINRILNPFAGNTPGTPLWDPPSASVLLAAWQRDRAGATATLDSANPKVIPTRLPNGDTITPASDYPLTVTGIYNMLTPPPGVNQSIQGYQKFDVASPDGDIESFYGYVALAPYLIPVSESLFDNQVIYVDSGVANLLGEPSGTQALPDGSVISTTSIFGGRFINVYAAITSPDGNHDDDVVTNVLTNTKTGQTLDLSWLVNAPGFNAADVPPVLPSYIRGVGNPTVTAISGIPPATVAIQGYQALEYLNADGTIGNFNALVTSTTDIVNFYTQAILVTETGTGAYAPPIGSVYNTVKHGDLANVYSSIPQDDGTVEITNVVVNTATGRVLLDLSWLFQDANASAGLTDPSGPAQAFSLGDYSISPAEDNPEVYTGINGLPPVHAIVQGTQEFDVTFGGDSVGTFQADVATIPTMVHYREAQLLLVTESSTSAVPVGSMIDVRSYGYGFATIYSDLPGAGAGGQNLITNTLVTPWGTELDLSWLVPAVDAAIGLNPSEGQVSYMNNAWLDLFNPF